MPDQTIAHARRLVQGRLFIAQVLFAVAAVIHAQLPDAPFPDLLILIWAVDLAFSAADLIQLRAPARTPPPFFAVSYGCVPLLASLFLPVELWHLLLLAPLAILHAAARLGRKGFYMGIALAIAPAAISVPALVAISPLLAVASILSLLVLPAYQVHMVWALQENERSLQLENARRARFLSIMSHELRTPLNTVCQAAELLSAERLSARQHHLVNLIDTAAMTLANTVNEVLDRSRIENDQLPLNPEPFNLRNLVMEVRNVLAAQSDAKGLQLSLDVLDDLPDVIVCDPARLRQILLNLGGNAVRFTTEGSVEITLRRGIGTRSLRLQVADTGPGIPEEERDRVFQPFYQVSTGAARTHGGTGLGLDIVAGIVRAMSGTIRLDDNPGGGLLVTVELAVGIADDTEAVALQHSTHIAQLFALHREKVRPLSILIVEDNPLNAAAFTATLGHAGHQAAVVDDGRNAIERIRRDPFDLILLDLNMPHVDGWGVLEALEKSPGLSRLPPIVICTADQTPESRETSLAMGAVDFVTKPVDVRRLLSLLARIDARRHDPQAKQTQQPLPAEEAVPASGSDVIATMRELTDDVAFAQFAQTVQEAYVDYAERIELALRTRDAAQMARIAHDLKSDAGAHRLFDLQHAAARLEVNAQKAFDPQEVVALQQLLATSRTRLNDRLNRLRLSG